MNYFAHGLRYVDHPYFLAGTAVPDWLSVADRRVRLRARHVEPFVDHTDEITAQLAAGVLQHLEDDRWFHRTPAFYETTGRLTASIRDVLGPEDGFRPGFLGHITTELLLDAVLIERHPDRLKRYYAALERLEPAAVQSAVNRMAKRSTTRLALFIPRFRSEQFLRDYLEPPRLLFRLNQVMRRIKLRELPEELVPALKGGRRLVEEQLDGLLPPSLFVS